MTDLIPRGDDLSRLFLPNDLNKDERHRLTRFVDWMQEDERRWWQPDLMAYRDFLLSVGGNDGNGLAPGSVRAHLATIRGRYRQLLRDQEAKHLLYVHASRQLQAQGMDDDPANRKAVVDELRTAIQDAIHPDSAPLSVPTDQDPDRVRLTVAQANALLRMPTSARDRAVIGLMLATGIREAELCSLSVKDLRAQTDDGALALRVRYGKGNKSRKVPYGDHAGVLELVDAWLSKKGITEPEALVFPLSERTVQRIFVRHPVMVNGEVLHVTPHTLRRTYARRLYESGMDLVAIQQNMGHADPRTTLGYIGELDGEARRPAQVFDFDVNTV